MGCEVMPNKYVEKILRAQIYDVVKETPLQIASRLSQRLDNHVLLKREDLQPVFSFKLRGAYNALKSLDRQVAAKGVIAASAGNHAQGVAYSAKCLGIDALIVMPSTTPQIKISAVKSYGAEVILTGDSYDEAYIHALELVAERGLTLIHPFDDSAVIAGQGTIAMELLRQNAGPPDVIFVPVGGGGLISGIGAYVKSVYPQVKVIGVEPEDAPTLHRSLVEGRRVVLPQVGIFADGVAVKQLGQETFRVAKQVVDEVVLVSTDEICAAIKDLFDDTRTIAEPAGALAVAGLKRYVATHELHEQQLVAIESGANINFDRLRHVAERAELGENHEALLAVDIPEKEGSFLAFCMVLGKRSVTEFNYRYTDCQRALVFVGVELRGGVDERSGLVTRLQEAGYKVVDMTDNETAKLHIRYMVGGHAPSVEDERLYRFEFPERPGALLDFLSAMDGRWNISLFHYRNHGAAYGRVLMGVQVLAEERVQFQQFLQQLGYRWTDETENLAYQLFAGTGQPSC